MLLGPVLVLLEVYRGTKLASWFFTVPDSRVLVCVRLYIIVTKKLFKVRGCLWTKTAVPSSHYKGEISLFSAGYKLLMH